MNSDIVSYYKDGATEYEKIYSISRSPKTLVYVNASVINTKKELVTD